VDSKLWDPVLMDDIVEPVPTIGFASHWPDCGPSLVIAEELGTVVTTDQFVLLKNVSKYHFVRG
jgi:hypothetical protein